MSRTIWWTRRDLRLGDNQALSAAARDGEVIAAFILDPKLLASPFIGDRRLAFLFGGLSALDAAIRFRGGRIIIRRGDPAQELAALCRQCGATAVFAERDYSPYAARRDAGVAAALPVPLLLTGGVMVRSPETTLKDDGAPYTVYTPYSRRWRAHGAILDSDILSPPDRMGAAPGVAAAPLPPAPALQGVDTFPPGESAAQARLAAFVNGDAAPIYTYGQNRHRPDVDGTSALSPYLRFGMISPRVAVHAAYRAIDTAPDDAARKSADTWLSELIWREFYLAILHHFPHVRGASFRPEYDRIAWRNDETEFAAWCAGQTGYPFIDAAMRQLAATGWMHNRARMAVASFLVKDLLIDWQWGERWFMQQLIDGDPAANNGGWQWTAGTGTDAAPYFRIFNPVSQGEKFDPAGDYVRRWVPEMRNVPVAFIHEPWRMARSEQIRARCIIGQDYPAPIVDHAEARTRVLDAFKAVGEKKAPSEIER